MKSGNAGGARGPRKPFTKAKEALHKINHLIRASQVRLVGENIEKPGIYPTAEALKLADEFELDLVEITSNIDPPVCKIIDYQKFLYQQKKKQKEIKAHTAKVVVKEIRFGPNTDDHDYNFKMKHAITFLQEGAKVKATVLFRGRSIIYSEHGEILLLRLASDVEEYGKVEQLPKLEGKRMGIIIASKGQKK